MPEKLTFTSPPPSSLDASEMIASVVNLSEFKRSREDGIPVSRAIARAALKQTGLHPGHRPFESTHEDTYEPQLEDASIDTIRYALIGELPSFVHGIEGIRAFHEEGRVDQKAYRSMKGRTARFNHAIKALIEHDSSLTTENLTATVATLYGVLNRERWTDDRAGYEREAKWATQTFEGNLRGMQQEVIARQVIEAIHDGIPGAEQVPEQLEVTTQVSVEDDLRGVDMYVTLDGVTFPVDIKASWRTAENTRKKSHHPKSIMTTGINSLELQGAFHCTPEQLQRAAPAMLKNLYAARAEYLAQHKNLAQTHALAA